jgi:hypothetical protein
MKAQRAKRKRRKEAASISIRCQVPSFYKYNHTYFRVAVITGHQSTAFQDYNDPPDLKYGPK